MNVRRETPGPGQESVWDYPRPPRLEPVPEQIRIVFNGVNVVETDRAWRVLETSHPPVYDVPVEDVARDVVEPSHRHSFCEWKGTASYVSLRVDDRIAQDVGWFYPDPTPAFHPIRDHVAFYAGPMDGCWVGDEEATPQPGGFYGGWGDVQGGRPVQGRSGDGVLVGGRS